MYECAHVGVVYPSAMWHISIIEFLTLNDFVIWTYFVTCVSYFCCWFSGTFGTVEPSQMYDIITCEKDMDPISSWGFLAPFAMHKVFFCNLPTQFQVLLLEIHYRCYTVRLFVCEPCTMLTVYYVPVYGNKIILNYIYIYMKCCSVLEIGEAASHHSLFWGVRGSCVECHLLFSLVSPIVSCSMINRLILGCLWPLVFVLNSMTLWILRSAISYPPDVFAPKPSFRISDSTWYHLCHI